MGFRLSRKKGEEEEGGNEVMAAAAAAVKEGENVFPFRVLGDDEGRGGGGKIDGVPAREYRKISRSRG